VLNQPRYKGAQVLLRARELRLRVVARARAVGAAGLRFPHGHRAELRRHLLQQLLQERPAAGVLDCRVRSIKLFREVEATEGYRWGRPRKADGDDPGGKESGFEIDAFRKHCLLNGLDEIGLTLSTRRRSRPSRRNAGRSSPGCFVSFD
jgi:3-isopropylmalate/(R)-2-methylmalate dehydratase small subunit